MTGSPAMVLEAVSRRLKSDP
ncbi:MAG: hypothetical protein QOF39_2926, partial [Frankiales bacterium]|nr:hypothetical protein [Frankiales bacterium]